MKGYSHVFKYNPNHDEKGRFATKDNARVVSGTMDYYHGTSLEAMGLIKKDGFKTSKGGMYGNGVYLSPSKEGAHVFSDGAVIKVSVGGKRKDFTERDFEDWVFGSDVTAAAKKLMEGKDSLSISSARNMVVEEYMNKKGYTSYSIKRNSSTFVVVPDPSKIKLVSSEEVRKSVAYYYIVKAPN